MREKYNKRRLSKKMIKVDFGNKNIMLVIDANGEKQVIDNKVLESIWSDDFYLNDDKKELYLENSGAEVYGKYVVCWAYIAQGQGGIVFVWDTDKKEVVHYSNGEFVVKACLHDNKIYTLRLVSYWGVKAHLELDYCEFGTKSEESENIEVETELEMSNNRFFNPDDYFFEFDSEGIVSIRTVR